VSALMVQGCSSWAGKSLLATGLCRSFARRGVRVAPFKAFNMSNNARVVDGGEIATAQYLQAAAAATAPDVRMNPVLVKPEADDRSQVVVLGKVDPELSRTPWRGRTASLWPRIEEAFHWLDDRFDLVIAEGAGSPAEINLGTLTSRTCGWPSSPAPPCCSWPTSTGEDRSHTSTAPGRSSRSATERASRASC
jgi:adenosylcobyric acid synthase